MAADFSISSSPPRQITNYSLSSSSPLPSMDEILQRRPQTMRSGSRVAPIPSNASLSLTTAASPLKLTPGLETLRSFNAEYGAADTPKPEKVVKVRKPAAKKVASDLKPAKPRKNAAGGDNDSTEGKEKKKVGRPRAKKVDEDGVEKPVQVPKVRAKKADPALDPGTTKEKPARKPRVKKADVAGQSKLVKGKVTKASTSVNTKDAKAPVIEKAPKSPLLDLPKALKKRDTWTPPKGTDEIITLGTSSTEKPVGFGDLFDTFGFTKMESDTDLLPPAMDVPTRKRKLIELVNTNTVIATVISPEKKVKGPKKKAQTITEKATSAYRDEEEVPGLPAVPAPLLQYFALESTTGTTIDGFKVPLKSRSKSPIKGKKSKGTAQAPILLSPESAMKQVGVQDFVFGTSSQLAREDSPTLLRDLHAAMQASNKHDDSMFSMSDSSPPPPRRRKELTTKRNLWSAASRDESGELHDIPMVDLVDSPVVNPQQLTLITDAPTPIPSKQEVWHDVDPTPIKNGPAVLSHAVEPIITAIVEPPVGTPSKKVFKSPKGAKPKLAKKSTPTKYKPPAKAKKGSVPEPPNYAAFTDAQLAKKIASYHFKPVKKRAQMIALLEQCEEGKRQIALRALSTNMSVPPAKSSQEKASQDEPPPSAQPVKASPKRPRGRPPKATTVQYLEMDSDTPLSQVRTPTKARKTTEHHEDISDSDESLRLSVCRAKLNATPLPLTTTAEISSPDLDPEATQQELFKHISRAITNAPRSKEPKNPSWHEKILLYDPIVLEELTKWLNTGGLDSVGWDDEVEPKIVKKWCESKSICCLWRENLRTGARNRY